jgi:nicotinamidase-related amidase
VKKERIIMQRSSVAALTFGAVCVLDFSASAQTVIQEWSNIRTPPAPELKAVTVDPNTTAVLMLDFMNQNCGQRPRCVASIPAVQKLLSEARAKRAAVVYSIIANTTTNDIRTELAPRSGEPAVQSGPDKFFRTDLEQILREKQIRTVIVTGTAAHGAVLYTASGAALRGFNVVVPVDGMSSEPVYPEQYTAWHLANAPAISSRITLTQIDMIKF